MNGWILREKAKKYGNICVRLSENTAAENLPA